MTIEKRIEGFENLGNILKEFCGSKPASPGESNLYKTAFAILDKAVLQAEQENQWFTRTNVLIALKNIALMIGQRRIGRFVEKYEEQLNYLQHVKTIAVVMAGNIPLAGFHDLFCVMMTRHRFLGKLSSGDSKLLPAIAEILSCINPEFGERIRFTELKLEAFDALIATGSNNTYRYFEYYFGKYPHILRKTRNGVAILTGRETRMELNGLADDILTYFGKGCRSVSKLYLPLGFRILSLEGSLSAYSYLLGHHKYANNYNYHKTVCIVDQKHFTDMGHLILIENAQLDSPVSVVHYEFYSDLYSLTKILEGQKESIQCIVTHDRSVPGSTPPGTAQSPDLLDFADGVDTMVFLLGL